MNDNSREEAGDIEGLMLRSIGDGAAHDLKRVSSSEAFEALAETKRLLNILYQ
ncbi:MAG: hypothetical protein HYX74_06020 [Acidobacteria bacterium]|nr:hypothetical protein [Acidobacteriota bacterium]